MGEMLQNLPWHMMVLVHAVFRKRLLRNVAMEPVVTADASADGWRHYVATWIRKDTESDELGSFRPLMQSSTLAKWLERVCLGPLPMAGMLRVARYGVFALD